MTQEEKAMAYDKAIEKIKYVMEHGVSPTLNKEDLQDIFPELKASEEESEDAKIRRAILDYLTILWGNSQDDICGVNVEDAIAWVEKQSPKTKWTEEDDGMVVCIKTHLRQSLTSEAYTSYRRWLESLKQRMEE